MDAVTDPRIKTVVVMSCAQVGKTETLLNIIGFHIAHDPAPILMLQPTLEMGEAFSKDRLAPMLRDTPALGGKVKDPRSRDSGNTLLHKIFPGGHVTVAGSNSAASLASRPIRIVLADEVDRYPPSAGTEGDPLNLAQRRTATFWNRKTVVTSTPTVKGFSRIEKEFLSSDQRRFYVTCPDCGAEQTLRWPQVQWPEGRPGDAAYVCEECGSIWPDAVRWQAIRGGRWRNTAPFSGIAGFHLNEIYSAWTRLGELAERFLLAKDHPETLKTWINTSLGETWDEDAERVDPNTLQARAEDWGAAAPAAILLATASVDTQDDRLEATRLGWGMGEECWILEHVIFYGDPSAPELWREVERWRCRAVRTADGRAVATTAMCVDTGGHHSLIASRFSVAAMREGPGRVYAIRGMGGAGKPAWPKRASKNNKARVNLFSIGVDTLKDMMFARLRVATPGPGYVHFPKTVDPQYFRQITAERVITKYIKGFPVRAYHKDPSARNEALDCFVYALAALVALNVDWPRLQAFWRPKERPPVQMPPPAGDSLEQPPAAAPASPPPGKIKRSVRRRRVVRSRFMG